MITKYHLFENQDNKEEVIFISSTIVKFLKEGGRMPEVIEKLKKLILNRNCTFTRYEGGIISGIVKDIDVKFSRNGIKVYIDNEWIPIDAALPFIINSSIENVPVPKIIWYKKGKLQESKLNEGFSIEKIIDVNNLFSLDDDRNIKRKELKIQNIFTGRFCEFRDISTAKVICATVDRVEISLDDNYWECVYFHCDSHPIKIDMSFPVSILKREDERPPKVRWYRHSKLEENYNVDEETNIYNINENALLKSTTFVPFEIRDQMDPDFEISDVEDYKSLKLSQNISYLRIIIMKVINKNVTFHSFNYLRNRTSNIPNTWYITRVHFNNNGLLVFDGMSKFGNESACVDEREVVIVNESKLYK